jgi:hypothetical protein
MIKFENNGILFDNIFEFYILLEHIKRINKKKHSTDIC